MVALDADAEARAATTFEATEELLDETLVVARADYAILWTFRPAATEDEKDMLTCGAYRSVDGVLMEGSSTVTFAPAEGVLGQTWSLGSPFFAPVVSALDEVRFPRKQLAMFERVRSIAAFKFANGVLELGCKKGWAEPPHLDRASVLRVEKKLPLAAQLTLDLERPGLLERVLAESGAHYALFYLFYEQVEELKCRLYASEDGELMRQSRTFPFTSGMGAIGMAWEAKSSFFIADAVAADPRKFLRQPLAEVYAVHSIAFICFKNGILEFGSRGRWEAHPGLPEALMRELSVEEGGGGGGGAVVAAKGGAAEGGAAKGADARPPGAEPRAEGAAADGDAAAAQAAAPDAPASRAEGAAPAAGTANAPGAGAADADAAAGDTVVGAEGAAGAQAAAGGALGPEALAAAAAGAPE